MSRIYYFKDEDFEELRKTLKDLQSCYNSPFTHSNQYADYIDKLIVIFNKGNDQWYVPKKSQVKIRSDDPKSENEENE